MWWAFLQRTHLRETSLHPFSHQTCRHSLSLIGNKQSFWQPSDLAVSGLHVITKRGAKLFTKGNNALFISLARYFQLVFRKVNHFVIKSRQFRKPNAGFIESHDNRTVTYVFKTSCPVFPLKQPVHLLFFQELRQRLALFRSRDAVNRVLIHKLSWQCKTIKGTQRTQSPIDWCSIVSFIHHALHPVANNIRVYRLPRYRIFQVSKELLKRPKVIPVVLHRQFRAVTLKPKIVEKLVNHHKRAANIYMFMATNLRN